MMIRYRHKVKKRLRCGGGVVDGAGELLTCSKNVAFFSDFAKKT